jgi:hypothetical protein
VAEKTIVSSFDRRRIVPQKAESVSVPVNTGRWYGTSPFAESLHFEEDQATVFPVYPGINVWVSSEGVLRLSGKTWVFTEWGDLRR